ncbi:MAG: T9SS type A sorting domain-containing protein, partial [bacterium]|nr:T9SS type A sorting domain-containing protein [bacterium]
NGVGDTARVILSGFSAHIIHDDRVQNPIDRVDHLADVIRWLQNDIPTPTAVPDRALRINDLAQNYPNPFNPTTAIRYSVAEPGQVTVVVFNVAGQRVRTLVDGFHAPQSQPFVVRWDGTNQSGDPVSSGVYYYRLSAPHYSATRKMVLIK